MSGVSVVEPGYSTLHCCSYTHCLTQLWVKTDIMRQLLCREGSQSRIIQTTRLKSRYRSISAQALRAARGASRPPFFLNSWHKYFFENIFGKFFLKIILTKIFFQQYFWRNFFENIFSENIFGENIFWHKYFFGKGTSLSLPRPCPIIQPLHTTPTPVI